MKALLPFLLATTATPALAQHDHHAPADPLPIEGPATEPMEGGHEHTGHAMPPAPTKEAHAAHPGHEPGVPDPPAAPASAEARSGPVHAADTIFGAEAMAPARDIVRNEHGNIRTGTILIDRLEASSGHGGDGYAWDAQAHYGGDIDRLWMKTEGEGRFGDSLESAEVQALWSHAANPWFNVQAGVRQDFGPDPERTHAVLGVQGLAPYWFEVDGALFLSNKGDLTARAGLEYDQRLTQKLIAQPEVEVNVAAQDVPELGIGSGLSTAEVGLRLRYQFVPEFAPYVGVRYERAFGDTAAFRRARGDPAGGWSFLTGLRFWL